MNKKMIDIVKDNYDKYNTYKVIISKYNNAIKDKYYFEALMISYALVEDRLRSFLYYLGLIETREDNNLFVCDKNIKVNIILKISKEKLYSYKFDNITSKINNIEKIIKWVDSPKNIRRQQSYLYLLNNDCESLDIGEFKSILKKIKKWLKYRNEITHGLLNKNIDSLNKELEDRIVEGKLYFDFFSSQVKILKENNNLRKLLEI